MTRHILSNPDDPDRDAREMAKEAARRAGLSLEEWVAAVMAARNGRRAPPAQERNAQERKPPAFDPDSLAPRPSKAARPELERNFETLMAAIATESERQAQDHASRTAVALESMASWIEQTEERLNETARASADQQDRMASALSQALSSLKGRLDTVERQTVTERQGQPDKAWMPAVNAIRVEIERLRTSMDDLATREEIATLDHALKGIAKDVGQGAASKDLLILAQSTAALYRQVQALSDDMSEGLHDRIVGEIDRLKARIETMAETGVDRSVIDFLSSQIVDMRHDLAQRAEPRQIERLSEEVTTLGRQIADLRIHQVGRNDFSALKTSLENVCAALNRTVEAQEASDVPAQLDSMSRHLATLTNRPAPEPVNLDPVTDQLALLTERMASLSESRAQQNDALSEMITRLSSQVQAVAEKEAPSHEPLMQRFDRIEEELRQVGHQIGQQTDTSSVEVMLRTIDEKLDRVPLTAVSLDTLEHQITSLVERLAQKSEEPLQKVLDETASHLRNLQNDAAGIAERAAKSVLKDLQPSLPDASDLDALKQGFVELKALQTRADKKTQETLHAVQSALETLIARFPQQSGPISQAVLGTSPEQILPADRLEAAVRRLHAVTLSQIAEVTKHSDDHAEPAQPEISTGMSADGTDLGTVRASFIAAARRAAQADKADQAATPQSQELRDEVNGPRIVDFDAGQPSPGVTPTASLIERIRRSFETHRRSLLLGLGLVILATGTAQVISSGLVPSPLPLIASGKPSQSTPVPLIKAPPREDAEQTGSISPSADKASLFQPSSLTMATSTIPDSPTVAAPKFLVDPATVGEIPTQVPSAIRQAALAGDAVAIYDIASRIAEGRGIPQDMILAVRLYERAAQAGLPPAQERLAMLMEKGIGIGRDLKQAAMWYERAAQGGNIRAMHNLATLLAAGSNGKPDYAAAMRWYNEAAEAGLKDSQFNMGILLARGIGTRQDPAGAYKWFALAAAQGDAEATKKRDELAGRLSAADLTAVRASVEQWRPRSVDPIANQAPAPADGQTVALDSGRGNRT